MARDSDIAACADCLCLASRRAARAITSAYDRRLRPHGVRITQFTILVMLILRGPTPVGALANALGMERTTLTRNLVPLESKGWVESRPAEDDSRARILAVTEAGRALVHTAYPDWRKAQRRVAESLGPVAVEALHALAKTAIE